MLQTFPDSHEEESEISHVYYLQLPLWKGNSSSNSHPNIPNRAGGARGVMAIVVGIGHDDTSSNPGRDWLHFS